ncbi:hypothetical protein AAG570_006829 [Ranatra chinensis]|uniref:Uncharacterized protein n=1 Tax=Ranatra chinensis TaxID=642074 RepID=A0ABD0Z7V8_9HEMI
MYSSNMFRHLVAIISAARLDVKEKVMAVYPFALLLGHANSAVNPLLYCWMTRNIRRTVLATLSCCRPRPKPRHPTDAHNNTNNQIRKHSCKYFLNGVNDEVGVTIGQTKEHLDFRKGFGKESMDSVYFFAEYHCSLPKIGGGEKFCKFGETTVDGGEVKLAENTTLLQKIPEEGEIKTNKRRRPTGRKYRETRDESGLRVRHEVKRDMLPFHPAEEERGRDDFVERLRVLRRQGAAGASGWSQVSRTHHDTQDQQQERSERDVDGTGGPAQPPVRRPFGVHQRRVVQFPPGSRLGDPPPITLVWHPDMLTVSTIQTGFICCEKYIWIVLLTVSSPARSLLNIARGQIVRSTEWVGTANFQMLSSLPHKRW